MSPFTPPTLSAPTPGKRSVAITNCHKQHKFITLQIWRSEVPRESRWVKSGCAPFWRHLEEILFSCIFQLLEAACISHLMAHFHLQNQQWLIKSFSHCIILVTVSIVSSPYLILTLSSDFLFSFKYIYDYIAPTCVIQVISLSLGQLISYLNSICTLCHTTTC